MPLLHGNVFMITGGRIPPINEMAADGYGLRSMCYIDPFASSKDIENVIQIVGEELSERLAPLHSLS
jgi:hypothetical protein